MLVRSPVLAKGLVTYLSKNLSMKIANLSNNSCFLEAGVLLFTALSILNGVFQFSVKVFPKIVSHLSPNAIEPIKVKF